MSFLDHFIEHVYRNGIKLIINKLMVKYGIETHRETM